MDNEPTYTHANAVMGKPAGGPLMTLDDLRSGISSSSFAEQQEAIEMAANMEDADLSDLLNSTTASGIRNLLDATNRVAITHRQRADAANGVEQRIRNHIHAVASYGLESELVVPARG